MNFGNIVIMMSKFGSKSGDFAQRGGLTVQNLHQIFNDILKFETQYRVKINAKSNQFFRDYIVDRIEIKNAEPVNPASTFIKEIFDFLSKKLKSETDVS